MRNTVACIDDDLVDDVVTERIGYYFPEGGSAAVHLRSQSRMKFITAKPGRHPDASAEPGDEETAVATGDVTMGMMAEATNRDDDWMDDLLR